MMEQKIFDSELRILEILWAGGDLPAKDVAAAAAEQVGWSKTTTYTVLKKCVDKGLVRRMDPGFLCRAQVSREDVRRQETRQLIDRMYGGQADRLVACFNEGFVSGLYTVGNMKLYVSNGAGIWNGFPIRIGVPSEIVLIRLRKE